MTSPVGQNEKELPYFRTVMNVLIVIVAFLAGAVAAVAGFGIGSFLTPAFALKTGIELAVAAVAIPHFFGTVIRFWLLRKHLDGNSF